MPPSRKDDGHRSAPFGHGSRGFSLVEIAVIIGLLGLLSSLGLLAAKKTIRQARTSATIAQMGYIEQALVTLAAHCEGLPIFLGTGEAKYGWGLTGHAENYKRDKQHTHCLCREPHHGAQCNQAPLIVRELDEIAVDEPAHEVALRGLGCRWPAAQYQR